MRTGSEGIATESNIAAEYQAARFGVGLADLSSFDRIEVTGKDRAKLIGNLCTNEIIKLPAATGCEAFFLNAKGKVIDYGMIYSVGESLWIDLEPGHAPIMIKYVDRYIFREDVKLHDRTASHALFHVAGPKAEELLTAIEFMPTNLTDRGVVIWETEGISYQIRRRARSVEGGYDVVAPIEHAATLWERLIQAGQPLGLVPLSDETMETLRVEASIPRFGKEVTEDNLPQEIGRDKEAISFTKGCYIGQETVARLDAYGHVNKILRGLEAELGSGIESGQKLIRDGKTLGSIATVVDSPRWNKRIALAIIRVAGVEPGSMIDVETAGGSLAVKVVALPFAGT